MKTNIELVHVDKLKARFSATSPKTITNGDNEPAAVPIEEDETPATPGSNPFHVLTEDDALAYALQPGDRIVVKGDIGALRTFRTIMGVAWVGLSDHEFHEDVEDVVDTPKNNHDDEKKPGDVEDAEDNEEMKEKKNDDDDNEEDNTNNKETDLMAGSLSDQF